MKRNKIIKTLLSLGICVSIITSSIFVGMSISKKRTIDSKPKTERIEQEKDKEIDYKEIIIKNLQDKTELKVIQSSLHEEVVIRNSQYDNKLFKNNNIINVKGNGMYYVSIENLRDNIIIKGNDIYIIAKLKVDVSLNEEDITISTEKGLLSLYNKKIDINDYNKILTNVKDNMLEKAKDEDYVELAKKKGGKKIEKIIGLGDKEDKINIHIIWNE